MMATVPHVTSGLGLRKFQADGFLLTRVYQRLALDGKYKKKAGPCPMPEESSTHSTAGFYKIYFNIISSYVVGSLKFSFFFTVPYQNFVRIYLLSCAIPLVCPLILLP